eukprot:scaffold560902_cov15-Prasinocladus_malaysianus.AAC.1
MLCDPVSVCLRICVSHARTAVDSVIANLFEIAHAALNLSNSWRCSRGIDINRAPEELYPYWWDTGSAPLEMYK